MNLQFSSKLNLWYNAKVWKWRLLPLALSTNLREVSQCPTWALSLLKAFSGHCETWQRFVDSSSSHTAAVLAVCLKQRLVTMPMLHGSPAPATSTKNVLIKTFAYNLPWKKHWTFDNEANWLWRFRRGVLWE